MGKVAVRKTTPSLLANLITYWPLSEVSGGRADLHTNGYSLSEVGTLASGTGLVYPKAGAYDMTADNALTRARADSALINFSSATPFTIVAWLYLTAESGGPDSPTYYRSILNLNGGSYALGGYTLHTTNGRQLYIAFGCTTGVDDQYTYHIPLYLTLNQWQMFAVTHNAGALGYYLDGETVSDTNSHPFTAASAGAFYLGCKGGNQYVWDGRMGPVMMFDTALSLSNLNWLYNGGAGRTYEVMA